MTEEIRAYISINIIMGVIIAPKQSMYFSNDSLFCISRIKDQISQDRLNKLNQYFHVADTTDNPPKNNPIIDLVTETFKSGYNLQREISIDEAMIAYTGQLSFKQFVPQKPTKRGIKVWSSVDPHDGFVSNFQIYTGREGNVLEKSL